MGRQHQGMDRPGVQRVPEGSGKQGKMEKTGCKIICGAQTTLAVKELMMMIMTSSVASLLVLLELARFKSIPVRCVQSRSFQFSSGMHSCDGVSRTQKLRFSAENEEVFNVLSIRLGLSLIHISEPTRPN